MKTATKQPAILHHMKRVACKLEDSALKDLKSIAPDLRTLRKEFGLDNNTQVMALAVVFSQQCCSHSTNMRDMVNYVDCHPVDLLGWLAEIDMLEEKGWLARTCDNDNNNRLKIDYLLPQAVFGELVAGVVPRPQPAVHHEFSASDFVDLANCYRNTAYNPRQVLADIATIEGRHTQLPMVQWMQQHVPLLHDRAFFYCVCAEANDHGYELIQDTTVDLGRIVSDVVEDPAIKPVMKMQLSTSSHLLNRLQLLRYHRNGDVALDRKGIELLMGKDVAANLLGSEQSASVYDFVNSICTITEEGRCNNPNEYESRMRRLKDVEKQNKQLPAVQNLHKLLGGQTGARMLVYCVASNLVDGANYLIGELSNIYDTTERLRQSRLLKDGEHVLITQGICEVMPNDFLGNSALALTAKGRELIFGDDANLFDTRPAASNNLLDHGKIKAKELFFEPELERQLQRLEQSLMPGNYQDMVARLRDKGMPTGVAALLYGLPGTGKTETVMQLARRTGRDVMHVDIASTKSCYLGESEKLIKGVFDDYRKLCQSSEVKPILLFNEADGVFGKRLTGDGRAVDKTLNAMQNIILEEMENLDGILIATTNLTGNLDSAFERRFLHKVEFGRPTADAKMQIWHCKLPVLTQAEARQLADEFDFSGGEIDNIARKAIVDEVVTGAKPTLAVLQSLCRHEKIAKHQGARPLGFS